MADALRERFPNPQSAVGEKQPDGSPEQPADLYLHKIVQTTVPIPALSRFDTEAYLVLLQLQLSLGVGGITPYLDHISSQRRTSGVLDELPSVNAEQDIAAEMTLASRLTPILYEKLRGNPRRIKRFLNDLRIRQSVAARRGITLDAEIVAKLMVLELLLKNGFEIVLGWVANSELRDRMHELEAAALSAAAPKPGDDGGSTPATKKSTAKRASAPEPAPESARFDDDLLRWAKMPPALSNHDLAPYLFLAASFSGEPLLEQGLPSRLRDIADRLLSSVRAQQKSVSDDDLAALSPADASLLVTRMGRAARDRPTDQAAAINAVLRLTRKHPAAENTARNLLLAIPAAELQPGAVLLLTSQEQTTFADVLSHWQTTAPAGTPISRALATLLKDGVT